MGWETRRSDGESKGEGTGQWVAAAIRGRIWFSIRLGLKSRSTGGRKWDQGRARGQRPTGRRRNGSGEGGSLWNCYDDGGEHLINGSARKRFGPSAINLWGRKNRLRAIKHSPKSGLARLTLGHRAYSVRLSKELVALSQRSPALSQPAQSAKSSEEQCWPTKQLNYTIGTG